MSFVKTCRSFKIVDKEFSSIRKASTDQLRGLQLRLFFLGFVTTLMYAFSPELAYTGIVNKLAYNLLAILEGIALCFSYALTISGSMLFVSLLYPPSAEFHVLGLSFERLLNRLDNDKIDDRKLEKFVEELKFHIEQHQKLCE
jgi:hypothetical protein